MSQAAIQAHDAWVEFMESLTTPQSQRYHTAWNRSTQETEGLGSDDFSEALLQATALAEVFVARPDTVELIEALAADVPYHPVLSDEDVPVDFGFVHLPQPLSVQLPANGELLTARIHAFVWHRTKLSIIDGRVDDDTAPSTDGRAVVIYALARGDDELDEFNQKSWGKHAGIPKWMVSGTRVMPADQSIGDLFRDRVLPENHWNQPLGYYDRWMITWWSLLRDQMRGMVSIDQTQMPRSARRRLERVAGVSLPPDRAKVKVVDLRRREAPVRTDGESSPVNWSVRWPVRPHWRRQWYPSIQQHQLKLIPPYIKGPADKPLKVKPMVYDLRPPGA